MTQKIEMVGKFIEFRSVCIIYFVFMNEFIDSFSRQTMITLHRIVNTHMKKKKTKQFSETLITTSH